MPWRDSDVVVRWDGQLVVRPVVVAADAPPAGEVRFTLEGAPARIALAPDRELTGARVGYLTENRELTAEGSADQPMSLSANSLGRLRGRSFRFSEATGAGEVTGAGSLEIVDDQAEATTITWVRGMRFRLIRDQSAAGEARLGGLAEAHFRGTVLAEGPTFAMGGETVDLWLEPLPDDPRQTRPKRLEAAGDVRVRDPELSFTGQTLAVDFAPLSEEDASADETRWGGDAQITRIEASGDDAGEVEVTLAEQGATVTAGRLVALPDEGRVDLFGTSGAPAVVVSPDGRIAGPHVTLDRASQQVDVTGAGDFAYPLDEADPDAVLTVDWTQRMSFDNRAGEAHFVGNVVTRSRSGSTDTELACLDMVLLFEPMELGGDNAPATEPVRGDAFAQWAAEATRVPGDEPETVAAEAEPDGRFASRIRRMVATDEVSFSATSRQRLPDGRPESSLYLEGPLLVFENQPAADLEVIRVVGPGKMGIQMLPHPRPRKDGEPDDQTPAAVAGDDGPVNFAGHGATAFQWDESLTLDVADNDVLFEGDVVMVHRPDEGEPVQLNCQTLLADMTETGGLASWAGRGRPDTSIELIRADDAVRLIQRTRTILADRLRYTAADRTVYLEGVGRPVETFDEATGAAMTADAIKWDLEKDRIEPTRARGIAPIPRD